MTADPPAAETANDDPSSPLFEDMAIESAAPGRRPRLALAFIAAIGLAAVLVVALNFSEISDFARLTAQAQPAWLLAALATQIAAFACVSLIWRQILRRGGEMLGLRTIFPLSVAKLFADQALPSAGLSGAVFMLHALGRRGVIAEKAFTAFIFAATTFIAAFIVSVLFSFIAVSLTENASRLLAIGVTAFVFFTIVLIIALIPVSSFHLPRRPDWLPRWRRIDRILDMTATGLKRIGENPLFFIRIVGLQMVQRGLDALTLWFAFHALGHSAPFIDCFIGVSIASVAATALPTPMGIGSFEGGLIAALNVFGIPVENALAATLLYRGLTLWLPLAPGFFIVQREMLKRRPGPANSPRAPMSGTP